MSTYVVGDLQGCLSPLEDLLERMAFDARHDCLWLTGDLVNRGPESLQTLRYLMAMGNSVRCVLGNHDLHLLAASAGHGRKHRSDTIADILDAPDRNTLIDWLRQQPLAYADPAFPDTIMVHAGVLPQWSAKKTLKLAREVEQALRSDAWQDFMAVMYGNQPDCWTDDLAGNDRLRLIINALTRLRFCTASGEMDFKIKDNAKSAPLGYMPWFEVPGRKSARTRILFGHWSTLGLMVRDDLCGLDTGCVWGGRLTGLRLDDGEIFSTPCAAALQSWETPTCG